MLDKTGQKVSAQNDTTLDDASIFFILLYEWFYLGVPFYDFICENKSLTRFTGTLRCTLGIELLDC